MTIAELLAASPVEPEAHLDRERVRHYLERGDDVPPVVVFDTEDGKLLADGYHRVAAARQRGRDSVEADVRPGSRGDALRYAAALAADQRGISVEDALARIGRQRAGG